MSAISETPDVGPEISVLIVCYRSMAFIEKCLDSIVQHVKDCTYEILLLDCSNDGVVPLVRDKYPAVHVVENEENLGFARGNNVLACHAKGQYLLLLNADTYLTDDAFSPLLKCATDPQWVPLGAVGGRARLPDGSRDSGSRQYVPTLFRLFVAAIGGARLLNGALPEKSREPARVESLTGAFMMAPRNVWSDLGGLDESFFAYCEEMDFCMRLHQVGRNVVMTPHAEVVHIGGGGSHRAERTLLKTRAMMHLIRKHWSHLYAWLGGIMIWFHAFVRTLAGLGQQALRFKSSGLLSFRDICLIPSVWWLGFEIDESSTDKEW